MGRRRLVLAVLLAGAMAFGGRPAPASAIWMHGCTVVTDPSGDVSSADATGDPSIDITSMDFYLVDKSTLGVRVHVTDMELVLPPNSNQMNWGVDFQYNQQEFNMEVFFDGTSMTYQYFYSPPQPSGPTYTTGAVQTGPDGYVEVHMPLSFLGDSGMGDVLTSPWAVGSANHPNTLLESLLGSNPSPTDFTAIGNDYTVGATC